MPEVRSFAPGGYRYVEGVFQYSAGVAAERGFEIERARFLRPVVLADGFSLIEQHLRRIGRPPTALCACELRSPAPFTESEFGVFNRAYVRSLERWGLIRDGINPVARTNVCPAVGPANTALLYAFSYSVPARPDAHPSFVVAGSAEAPEGRGNYRDHAIRLRDRSVSGLREKAQWVLGEMERRMHALGFDWSAVTGTHLYTIYDIHPFLADELAGRGAMPAGLTWHFARPPVEDLDYEMDVRGVARELVI